MKQCFSFSSVTETEVYKSRARRSRVQIPVGPPHIKFIHRWPVLRSISVILLITLIFGILITSALIYQYTSVVGAKVAFRKFPCAYIAKPDKIINADGFTFYVYIPLSHEDFLNTSIAEKAKYHPEFATTYCLLQQKYLDKHPDIKARVKSALKVIYTLSRDSSKAGWRDLVFGGIYLPKDSAIYIGIPRTMNRSLLINIVTTLQKVALKYKVNIYLYDVTYSWREYQIAFMNMSPEELSRKLKSIGVNDEAAMGYDWMTERGIFLINMSITNPDDPKIMKTLQKISQIYSSETSCKEIIVVFLPYYTFS